MTIASAVIGFPGETEETAWETINFINSLNPDDIGFYVATPYPGTPMYEQVIKNGWLRVTDFNKYDTATPTFETPESEHGKNPRNQVQGTSESFTCDQATCSR